MNPSHRKNESNNHSEKQKATWSTNPWMNRLQYPHYSSLAWSPLSRACFGCRWPMRVAFDACWVWALPMSFNESVPWHDSSIIASKRLVKKKKRYALELGKKMLCTLKCTFAVPILSHLLVSGAFALS